MEVFCHWMMLSKKQKLKMVFKIHNGKTTGRQII